MAKLVRAISTFACDVNGEEQLVRTGELLPANDPIVKARPELFEVPIEQATAAPGEKRRR
jgi:hypothetical protein